jgi:hypothetical protein
MTAITDPARELAEIAARLTKGSNKPGEVFLAEEFGVERSSTEFFKVITCILARADRVGAIIEQSNMDKDHQDNALNDLTRFKGGFTGASLAQRWDQFGLNNVRDHGRPIQYLSPVVRQRECYPKLSDEEVAEFLTLIDQYLAEIRKSDEGPPFVRQSIVDGLTAFRFQLQMIGWMGSGYTMAAFREVMIAYEAAAHYGGQSNPDAFAFLKGLGNIVSTFKKKADEAKSWTDTAEAVWKFYQIGSAVATPYLIGKNLLLPHLS